MFLQLHPHTRNSGHVPIALVPLQNFALQSQAVALLNDQAAGQPRRYPIPAFSIQAASALQPTTPPTAAAATATSRHLLSTHDSIPSVKPTPLPTHTAPTSVLLLTPGSPIGAVADIMAVDMLQGDDNASSEPVIALTLDVVHQPHIISELKAHPKQRLDSSAHYHFHVPAGVTLDAAKFLDLLKDSAGGIAGACGLLHC